MLRRALNVTSFCGLSIDSVDDEVYVSQTGSQKTVGDTGDMGREGAPWGAEECPVLSQSTVSFTDVT